MLPQTDPDANYSINPNYEGMLRHEAAPSLRRPGPPAGGRRHARAAPGVHAVRATDGRGPHPDGSALGISGLALECFYSPHLVRDVPLGLRHNSPAHLT